MPKLELNIKRHITPTTTGAIANGIKKIVLSKFFPFNPLLSALLRAKAIINPRGNSNIIAPEIQYKVVNAPFQNRSELNILI